MPGCLGLYIGSEKMDFVMRKITCFEAGKYFLCVQNVVGGGTSESEQNVVFIVICISSNLKCIFPPLCLYINP